jgi:hypothetical protein
MLYSFAPDNPNYRHANNLEIENKRPPMEILIVELYLDKDRQFIAAVHLSPSGQSRHKLVNTSLSSGRNQIVLIEQCRARPHHA